MKAKVAPLMGKESSPWRDAIASALPGGDDVLIGPNVFARAR